jgi:SNF2 family DNA or RNA helicase
MGKIINFAKYKETWRSPKFIILAHILVKAMELDEKILVYSKCLKTLDMIEELLQSSDWKKQVSSLTDAFPDTRNLGNWKKNTDFLRIDGSTESGKRGYLVNTFNKVDTVRAFLISSIAGGIGINLVRFCSDFYKCSHRILPH